VSLRAKRSNRIHNKINHFEIAASLTLLAMTARIEFFRKLLVNWINFGRKTDFDAHDRYHALRDKNRKLAAEAREQEKSNLAKAIDMYFQALPNIEAYATIQAEGGLVGMLIDEERQEFGIRGDSEILDRLSLCLVRAGRGSEALTVASQYFERYRADQSLSAAERIKKRVGKAAANGG